MCLIQVFNHVKLGIKLTYAIKPLEHEKLASEKE